MVPIVADEALAAIAVVLATLTVDLILTGWECVLVLCVQDFTGFAFSQIDGEDWAISEGLPLSLNGGGELDEIGHDYRAFLLGWNGLRVFFFLPAYDRSDRSGPGSLSDLSEVFVKTLLVTNDIEVLVSGGFTVN